jgi:hypothetical protein
MWHEVGYEGLIEVMKWGGYGYGRKLLKFVSIYCHEVCLMQTGKTTTSDILTW